MQPPPIPTFLLRSDARKHAQERNLALGEIDIEPLRGKKGIEGYTYSERRVTQPEPQETEMATKKKTAAKKKTSKKTTSKKTIGKITGKNAPRETAKATKKANGAARKTRGTVTREMLQRKTGVTKEELVKAFEEQFGTGKLTTATAAIVKAGLKIRKEKNEERGVVYFGS